MLSDSSDRLNVLIVDDDEVDRMALRRALKASQPEMTIAEADEADSALAAIAQTIYDCIFLDYHLPGKDGLDLTRQIRNQGIKMPIIILTGQGNERTAVELMKAGASDYLPKSELSAKAIARLMRSALQISEAQRLIDAVNRQLREKNALLEQQNRDLENQRHRIFRQNLQLQEVSELKSRFLATMSHELRTPLNAIIGFSQILLSQTKGPLTESQQNMLNRILANGQNQLALIEDILTFSKSEAGRLDLQPAELDLSELVNSTVEELRSLAVQKGLTVEVEMALADPIVVNDAVRLRQILVNLLSNAIKFTSAGGVQVTVTDATATGGSPDTSSPDTSSPDTFFMAVTDTGCGISSEDCEHIFEAFHQANRKVVRKRSGTGLGLAITYALVNIMRGEIAVRSQIDKGTTFEVELPRKVEPAPNE